VPKIRYEEIYESLFDDEAFARLPALLAGVVRGRSGVLHFRPSHRASEVSGSWNFPSVNIYAEKWVQHDPWFVASLQKKYLNRIGPAERAVSQSEFERSFIYNEFARTECPDIFRCMGGTFVTPYGYGSLGIHRGPRDEPFDQGHVERLRPLTKTIGQVLRLKGEILAARSELDHARDSLDSLALAIATVDTKGQLLVANAAAEEIFCRSDGLVVRNGVVTARSHSDASAFQCAIALASAAIAPRITSLNVRRGENEEPYSVTVAPLVGRASSQAIMVVFRDNSSRDTSLVGRLRGLYGLSEAEATIAIEIGNGRSASEIGKIRGVSANTLNTQIKSIMAKMNCSRQAQIAAVVVGIPQLR
jgi:DNA-binding CsgD family transcriptional regulator